MTVFVELVTDAFADNFNAVSQEKQIARRAGTDRARRPLRGLEIKDDTYSLMKVIQADGTELKLIDSSSPSGTSTAYTNYILQSVTEARMEKHQIVETFGEPYIFFFGESPRFLDVSVVLVDSLDFNWYAEFWENYNNYLRGTRSVELGARTYLFYDDNIVEGYMLQAQARKVSEQPLMAQLTFRLYLTNYQNISFVGDPNYPVRASVSLPPDVGLTAADEFSGGQSSGRFQSYQDMYEAAVAAAQQGIAQALGKAGFGGIPSLTQALQFGLRSALGFPNIESILWNSAANSATQGADFTRQAPVRGLISDNLDEYTGIDPSQLNNPPVTLGQEEPQDFWYFLSTTLKGLGVVFGSSQAFASAGVGPHFGIGAGVGGAVGVGVGAVASFGVGGGAGVGGLNGGLGFTGALTPNPILAATLAAGGSPAGVAVAAGVFGNGVAIAGGIIAGVGIGGGIPGGISTGTGPGGFPLQQFTGGTSFANTSNGLGLGIGVVGAVFAGGAAVAVGGAPSAFSMSTAPNVAPNAGSGFFIGAGGAVSSTNTTGVVV